MRATACIDTLICTARPYYCLYYVIRVVSVAPEKERTLVGRLVCVSVSCVVCVLDTGRDLIETKNITPSKRFPANAHRKRPLFFTPGLTKPE